MTAILTIILTGILTVILTVIVCLVCEAFIGYELGRACEVLDDSEYPDTVLADKVAKKGDL